MSYFNFLSYEDSICIKIQMGQVQCSIRERSSSLCQPFSNTAAKLSGRYRQKVSKSIHNCTFYNDFSAPSTDANARCFISNRPIAHAPCLRLMSAFTDWRPSFRRACEFSGWRDDRTLTGAAGCINSGANGRNQRPKSEHSRAPASRQSVCEVLRCRVLFLIISRCIYRLLCSRQFASLALRIFQVRSKVASR